MTVLLESGGLGGAEVHVRELVTRLDRRRVDPTVLLSPCEALAPLVTALEAAGVPVHPLPSLRARVDLPAFRRVIRAIAAERPDLLHVHLPGPSSSRHVFAAARLARVPVVVATEHSHAYRFADLSRLRAMAHRLVARMNLASVDRIVAVSEAQRRSFLDVMRIHSDRIVTIENGVDPDVFTPLIDGSRIRAEWGLDRGEPLVGMVTGFEPYERVEDFVQAAGLVTDALPSARFVVVGAVQGGAGAPTRAATRARLEALVAAGRLATRLRFAGFRPDMPQVMAALDVLVLPASYKSFGLVLIEAMATGKPVVATAAGGVPGIVRDGETGILVPPLDPAALAAAILRILGDPEGARAMGRCGRRVAIEHFSVRRMVERVETLYLTLLSDRPGRRRIQPRTPDGALA